MSRNKDKIIRALNAKGYEVADIDWTPIGGSPIMCGPEGGWYVEYNEGDVILGYNIKEVLEEIEELPEVTTD
jgi:hypothetical protein